MMYQYYYIGMQEIWWDGISMTVDEEVSVTDFFIFVILYTQAILFSSLLFFTYIVDKNDSWSVCRLFIVSAEV